MKSFKCSAAILAIAAKHLLRAHLALAVLFLLPVLLTAQTNPQDWYQGDVFVGIGNGSYQVWHSANPTAKTPTFSLVNTISDGVPAGGATNGCGFDLAYRFFGTNSSANLVDRYVIDNEHALAQQFPTAGNPGSNASSVQSIAFDGGANVYVGYTGANGGSGKIEQWTKDTNPAHPTYGLYTFNQAFSVPVDSTEGPGWIDLAFDGHTLYYTSQGSTIRTYNTLTNQAATYATLSGTTLFALRILPPGNGSGGVLVAAQGAVLEVSPAGTIVNTIKFNSDHNLQALSLDPSVSTHAWVGDASSNDVILFDFTKKGNAGITTLNPNVNGTVGPVGGLCVDGSYSGAELAALQTTTMINGQTVSPAANTVTFTSPYSKSTFTETFVGLSNKINVTVRDSLVDPSLALSDPTVFSFNPGGPGGTVPGNMICDYAATAAAGHNNTCELFEVEATPNSGYTTANTQIEPPATLTDLPNLRLLRNLDEDHTDDLDIGGTRSSKCVYTVNQQNVAGGFNNPTFQICSFTPANGTVLTKSSGSTIDFKLNVAPANQCSGGGNSGTPANLPLLLMIVQLQTNGTAPIPVTVHVAGNSGGFPIMAFSGNTYQLQVKTDDIPSGFTYVATVEDLSGTIVAIANQFTMK